jgi:hypothetical protein
MIVTDSAKMRSDRKFLFRAALILLFLLDWATGPSTVMSVNIKFLLESGSPVKLIADEECIPHANQFHGAQ